MATIILADWAFTRASQLVALELSTGHRLVDAGTHRILVPAMRQKPQSIAETLANKGAA